MSSRGSWACRRRRTRGRSSRPCARCTCEDGVDALNAVSLIAYAVATVLYLAFQAGLRPPLARAGRIVLGLGWVVQTVDIGIRCVHLQHPASSTPEAMAFIAWMIVCGYILASLRYRLHAAGAF